jgi:hypothetical protein
MALAAGACGGDHAASPDAPIDANPFGEPSSTYPGFSIPRPQVEDLGGPHMPSVHVVPIFYADDTAAATHSDFLTKFAASPYWTQMVGEYGVGALSIETPVVLATNAPATLADTDLQTLLTGALDGTHPEYGAVDSATLASTIYLFHTPATTRATGPGGAFTSCVHVLGYHSHFALPSTDQAMYAIVYDCAPQSFLSTTLQQTTAAISHELVEAATDPQNPGKLAWAGIVPVTTPWSTAGNGSELGDMCQDLASSWYAPADLGYMIQRSWSNAAMLAFHDPCVPHPPGGTEIPVGSSNTVTIEFASDGPTGGPWTIAATENNIRTAQTLMFNFDHTTGENGNVVHLTISSLRRPPNGIALYRITSTLGTRTTTWWAVVGMKQ